MIYGFIIDEALHKWDDNTLLASSVDQGAGYATENVLEYFNEVGVIRDPRTTRYPYLGTNKPMIGHLGFIIDKNPPNSDGLVPVEGEESFADNNETLDYDRISSNEWEKIFNIIEDTIYYRSGFGDNNDEDALLTGFLNVRFSSNTSYSGYEVGSLSISSELNGHEQFISNLTATAINKSNNSKIVIEGDQLSVPLWIQFSFRTSDVGIVTFKLWIDRTSFLTNYPYSTVCDVVLPTEASCLADPDSIVQSALRSIVNTSIFVQNVYSINLREKEATGATVFNTGYMPDSFTNANSIDMPFGIIYKGVAPSVDIMKKAIRAKLVSEGKKVDSEITEEMWATTFPYLFTSTKFYAIPFFNNRITSEPEYKELGITNFNSVEELLSAVFPYKDITSLRAHLEILVHDATNLLILILPDQENDSNKWLRDFGLGDYLPVDGTTSSYSSQIKESTKDFNELMAKAIAGANGSVLPSGFTEVVVDCGAGNTTDPSDPNNDNRTVNRTFYMFKWNRAEIYILPFSEYDKILKQGGSN